MKRITSLKADEKVLLELHSRSGRAPEVCAARFVRIEGEGDAMTATFIDEADTGAAHPEYFEFSLYRFHGSWVWGSSCDRASLIATL